MGTQVAECLRLASRGGPEVERMRGMTLWSMTSYLDGVLSQLADVDSLVVSQCALLERSERVYGLESKGYKDDKQVLEILEYIQNKSRDGLSKKDVAHLVMEALVDFEHKIGP